MNFCTERVGWFIKFLLPYLITSYFYARPKIMHTLLYYRRESSFPCRLSYLEQSQIALSTFRLDCQNMINLSLAKRLVSSRLPMTLSLAARDVTWLIIQRFIQSSINIRVKNNTFLNWLLRLVSKHLLNPSRSIILLTLQITIFCLAAISH